MQRTRGEPCKSLPVNNGDSRPRRREREGVVLDRQWVYAYTKYDQGFFQGATVTGFTASVPYLDDQPRPPKELTASVYRHGCDPPHH